MTASRRQFSLGLFALAAGLALPAAARFTREDELLRAIELDNAAGVRAALAAGADPNTREPTRGEAGLILAVREGSMKAFAVLLAAPGIDIERQARNGNTPLMMAAYKGNVEAVRMLLDKGAKADRDGWAPLHYAGASGKEEIVQMLLARGARVDAVAPQRMTPLMMAAKDGHLGAVKLLLAAGANPALKSAEGARAVDYATFARHDAVAAVLASAPAPAARAAR